MKQFFVLAVLAIGLSACNPTQPQPQSSPSAESKIELQTSSPDELTNDTPSDDLPNAVNGEKGGVQEFTVNARNTAFDTKEIRVQKGETVRIVVSNTQGTHDFVIDELNVKTKVLSPGKEEIVEFVAGKAGTYEYYCSVGNHRAQGMVGKLIVE